MPLNSESLSTQSREEFCLALKAARERKGVTLAGIADATKVPASLFAALERSDLRHWPKGLFRRAFFRGYARMIDVPMAEACAEFVRWFPDDGGAKVTVAGAAPQANHAPDVRLAFDPAWQGPRASVRSRLLAALLDAVAVVVLALAVAWVASVNWSAITAIVALAYFSLAMVLSRPESRDVGHLLAPVRARRDDAGPRGHSGGMEEWRRRDFAAAVERRRRRARTSGSARHTFAPAPGAHQAVAIAPAEGER